MKKYCKKLKILVLTLRKDSCCQLRLISPLEQNMKSGLVLFDIYILNKNNSDLHKKILKADVIIFHRPKYPQYIQYLKYAKKHNKLTVFELDDNMIEVYKHMNKTWLEKSCIKYIKNAHILTTTTQNLSDYFKKWNKNVYILPNYLDTEIFKRTKKKTNKLVKIGFAGSTTHKHDFKFAVPALLKIAQIYQKKVLFYFMGYQPDETKIFKNSFHLPSLDYPEYASSLQKLSLDIGLAPLKNTPWNIGKSNIKYLEYSACNTAGIYSDLGPYNNIKPKETGLLAENNTSSWFKALEELIKNKILRQNIIKQASANVFNDLTIQKNYKKWYSIYSEAFKYFIK